jgi:hypothetical protein
MVIGTTDRVVGPTRPDIGGKCSLYMQRFDALPGRQGSRNYVKINYRIFGQKRLMHSLVSESHATMFPVDVKAFHVTKAKSATVRSL